MWFAGVAMVVAGGILTACGGHTGVRANLYAQQCASCHGASGVPTEAALKMGAPNFADAVWQQKATDEGIRKKIVNGGGRGSLMPSFDRQLSAADLDGLVAYVRSLGPKP
jgi:mono/diheme cytochrome c family protein